MYDVCYVCFLVLRVLRLLGQTAAEQFRNAGSEARPNVGVASKKFSHFGAFLLLSAGGWFCLRFPHVGRRGWIHEAFQRVRSNRCVIPAAHQVRRTHRDATHITHHSVRSPPRGWWHFFSLPPPICSTRTTRARCFSSSSYITRATRNLVVCV